MTEKEVYVKINKSAIHNFAQVFTNYLCSNLVTFDNSGYKNIGIKFGKCSTIGLRLYYGTSLCHIHKLECKIFEISDSG